MIDKNDITALEDRIEDLIGRYSVALEENQRLKEEKKMWERERQELLEKNQRACTKVKEILNRIHNMEPVP